MSEIDVIVLGSGIAGCSAAALLAHKGYRVYLVSTTSETKHHLPESWIVNFPDYISSLGLSDALKSSFWRHGDCVFCSNDGTKKVTISVDSTSDTFQKGDFVTIDRDKFDRCLFEKAIDCGVRFLKADNTPQIEFVKNGVHLILQSGEQNFELFAPFIIDASGKSAFLIQKLGLKVSTNKLDHRFCSFSHFVTDELLNLSMQIISIESGHIFCIPTTSGRLSIGCVMEESCFNTPPTPDQIFAKGLSQSSYISNIVKNSRQVLPFIPIINQQKVCLEPCSEKYCIIGDAAIFMDPFFTAGIDFAFSSAEMAASTYENKSYDEYRKFLDCWNKKNQLSRYEQIDKSEWKSIIRLFSDPHQPQLIPLFLTQALGQLVEKDLSLNHGISLARGTYEAKIH